MYIEDIKREMTMTTLTHTIAMLGDMLVATAPDGDAATMAARIEDTRQNGLVEIPAGKITYHSGLTLFATEDDAEDAGAEAFRDETVEGVERSDDRRQWHIAGLVPSIVEVGPRRMDTVPGISDEGEFEGPFEE